MSRWGAKVVGGKTGRSKFLRDSHVAKSGARHREVTHKGKYLFY